VAALDVTGRNLRRHACYYVAAYDQKKKLFQFLNEIGARALRMHLGRVLEMAESSPDKDTYEQKIKERFGRQKEFAFMIPAPKEPISTRGRTHPVGPLLSGLNDEAAN